MGPKTTMTAMKPRDRIISTLKGEGADQVPLYPPYQGYWALNAAQMPVPLSMKKPKLAANIQIKMAEKFGFDGIEVSGDCFMPPVEALGCEVKQPDVGPGSTVAPIINERGDLDKLEIPDIRLDHRMMSEAVEAEYLVRKISKERFLHISFIGPFTLVGELRGVETLMLDTLTEPDFVFDMLKFASEVVDGYLEFMGPLGVDGVSQCDPTASGSLISPEYCNKFVLPYIKKGDRIIKKHGMIDIFHVCGDTSDRLEAIADVGAEIFSMDYQVDMGEACRRIGNRQALLGNVRPPHALFAGTPEMVLEESLACIEKAKGYRFFLGAGCDVPPGSPEENVMQMSRAIQIAKHKK